MILQKVDEDDLGLFVALLLPEVIYDYVQIQGSELVIRWALN